MKHTKRFLIGMASCLTCAAALAQEPPKPTESKDAGVAAYIDDKPVTFQELDEKILKTNMKLAQSLYDARRAAVDQVLLDRAFSKEAAEKKTTVEEVVKAKVAEKAKPVSDADIQGYFNANQARMQGKTLEQMSVQIKGFLAGQRESEARTELLTQIRQSSKVRVLLEAPRVEVAVAPNDATKGPATAKVTIVEFSEFQ